MTRRYLPLLLATLSLGSCRTAPELPAETTRAIWITRFDYTTKDDVTTAIDHVADLGFDTVLFQVRGNCTAFYRSSHEPWAEQLGWRDPGFDPLAVAVERAHARGMLLQAWVNVVPAWWGPTPPEDTRHVYHTHPEWFWYDQHGERQALSDDFYVSLNPCLPEVREYIVRVLGEIVARYDVDALHLDYIRFPNEPPAIPAGSGLDYPRDARTLELYRAATELAPDDDPAAWQAWRAEQVTQLVRDVRKRIDSTKPGLPLTAAVGPVPRLAYGHMQDYPTWLEEGLLDAVFPMNYSADEDVFRERLDAWREMQVERPVVMGVMVDRAAIEVRTRQTEAAVRAFGSVCLFAYSSFFDSRNETIDTQTSGRSDERRAKREAFAPLLGAPVGG